MKVTHATTYTADDGTEYTDARLCLAHEQVLVKGEHAYGTIEFEKARDALAATLHGPDRAGPRLADAGTCCQEGWK